MFKSRKLFVRTMLPHSPLCGADLITNYIKTEDVHVYLDLTDWNNEIIAMRQDLDLKQLVRGGNVHLIKPFYKHSVFFNVQMIKGYSVVSNLQLFLDTYNYHPRGIEHAMELRRILREKGKYLE